MSGVCRLCARAWASAPVVCPLWSGIGAPIVGIYRGLRMRMLANVGKAHSRAFIGHLSGFFPFDRGM